MEIDRAVIVESLKKKGFRPVDVGDRDHDYYSLFAGDRQTQLFMKISRGSDYRAYRDPLLKRQAHNWRVPFRVLVGFLQCPIAEPELRSRLRASGWNLP
jgi:hypothetical protein